MEWDLILQVTEGLWGGLCGWISTCPVLSWHREFAFGIIPHKHGHSSWASHWEKAAAMWHDPGPAEWLLLLALRDVPLWLHGGSSRAALCSSGLKS